MEPAILNAHLGAVHIVVRAVGEQHPDVDRRVSPPARRGEGLLDAGVNEGMYSFGMTPPVILSTNS